MDRSLIPYSHKSALSVTHPVEVIPGPGTTSSPGHSIRGGKDRSPFPHGHEGAAAVGYILRDWLVPELLLVQVSPSEEV